MLDLLEWQWFFTRPAELLCIVLAACLRRERWAPGCAPGPPQKGWFGLGLADHGGRECEVSLSQPAALASDVDVLCSYRRAAVLGSPRQFLKAVFICGAPLYAKHIFVVIRLVVKVFGYLCKKTCESSYRCVQ